MKTAQSNRDDLHPRSRGFTLLEMAIVLAIAGLLAGGLIPIAKAVFQDRKASDISERLTQAREVLYSYYRAQGHLPCPDNTGPLDSIGDGIQDPSVGGGTILSGKLPFSDLAFPPNDSTGRPIRYVVLRELTEHTSVTNGLRRNRCEDLKNMPASSIRVNDNGHIILVPFLVFSGGLEDRDHANGLADGDNRDGDATYDKMPANNTFDDVLEYGSAFELFKSCCGTIVVVNINSGMPTEKYDQTLRVDQSFDGGTSWITSIGTAPDGSNSGELDIEIGSVIRIYDPQSAQYIAQFVFTGGHDTLMFD